MRKTNNWLYLIPVVLFLVSFGTSTWLFRRRASATIIIDEPTETPLDDTDEDESLISVDNSMPKTEVCPLNGVYYTAAEREAWEKRRPLAVMIENTPDARPQSGLSNADVVFEAVAEGGITRFMALYYCDAQREDVTLAPIRSARTYYINLASGFNRPMYVHVGGANLEGPANALGQLSDYGWTAENDINQFSVGYPTFIRDYNRIPGKDIATEHTMTTTTEKLWAVAEKRGWTNMSPDQKVAGKTVAGEDWADGYDGWDFVDNEGGNGSQTISYSFWSGQPAYDEKWTYDADRNVYLRENGGQKSTDLNTDEQLAFENVIIMFAKEQGPIDDLKHMLYEVIGKGEGILFSGGKAQEITWSKKTRESELQFQTATGKTLSIPRGKIWISVVPTGNKIDY